MDTSARMLGYDPDWLSSQVYYAPGYDPSKLPPMGDPPDYIDNQGIPRHGVPMMPRVPMRYLPPWWQQVYDTAPNPA